MMVGSEPVFVIDTECTMYLFLTIYHASSVMLWPARNTVTHLDGSFYVVVELDKTCVLNLSIL